jgi:cytosine/adenosine deaminase-related metal-dependent hydrolase
VSVTVEAQGQSAELLDALARAGDGRRLLIRGGTIVSMDPAIGDLATGDLLIEGNHIEAVAPDLSEAAGDGQALVMDATGMIAIPGLQDTHRHSWQTQMRRLLPDANLGEYIELLHLRLGPAYRPEDMYIGNRLAAVAALDAGITCVLDLSHNRRTRAHADEAIRAWADSGIRTVFAPTRPIAGDWDGLWREDLVRLRESVFASDDQLMRLRVGVNARAVPDLVVGDLALSADTAALARGLGVGITADAVFGKFASDHLEELTAEGVLGPDVTFIHCTGISEAAWQGVAESGARVALAVTSDAQLGCEDGLPPIQRALDLGITPAMSIDVEPCLSTDMFTQMQVALNIQRLFSAQRHHHGDAHAPAPISVRDVLTFATSAGATANGVDDVSGTLTPGKQADVVLINAEAPNNIPLNNAIGTVVLGADSRNVEVVLVAGRPRKWAGALVDCDLAELTRQATESRDYLLRTVGYELDVTA